MEAQNTRHELSNIYWTALFNLGAKTFMKSHRIFFLLEYYYFWKITDKTFWKLISCKGFENFQCNFENVMKCSWKIYRLLKWEYNFIKFVGPNCKWVLFTFVKNDLAKLVQHTCAAWIRDLLTQLFLDNSISSRQNKIYYQIFANVHQQTCDLWKTLLYVFLFVKCF